MNMIFAMFPVICNVLIVAVIVLSIKKKLTQAGKKTASGKVGPNANNFNELISQYNKNSSKPSALKAENSMTLKDDRSSDWMARQLRDEALAMAKVSDMFQLKQSHINNCDAEFIKRFHESSCDAHGVDDGSLRKSKVR